MTNQKSKFWLTLLSLGKSPNERVRLWNGYLGWKLPPEVKGEPSLDGCEAKYVIAAPNGGWPELSPEEQNEIEELAKESGGHPKFKIQSQGWYMDFSRPNRISETDFSGLILIDSNFSRVDFYSHLTPFNESSFYGRTRFDQASFYCKTLFEKTYFDNFASFKHSVFRGNAAFRDAKFSCGASFSDAEFQNDVTFETSKFEGTHYSKDRDQVSLIDFRGAKFMAKASFCGVRFGNDKKSRSKAGKWERVVDFTDAEFHSTTDFREAVFVGAPAFFNTKLHEDTNFGCVDWRKAETDSASVGYAIRAWERLELEMSKLEKPLERHLFFRLKMRARRRADPWFLRFINWLFEQLADYGWGVGRAAVWWLVHWVAFSIALFANACPVKNEIGLWELIWAAFGTSFANAHVFLFLTAEGGYLESGRKLLENNDKWGLLTVVGTVESILGPIFLFFLLLTLRNRFRLA